MPERRHALPTALLALSLVPACSSGDGGGSEPSPQPSTPESGGPCAFESGFSGDERCIEPPLPEEGFQIHVGPTDYDDPVDVGRFVLEAGLETVECWHTTAPNDHAMYNRQRKYRMRPGTHHLILKNGDGTEGWGSCPGALAGSWGGSQNGEQDVGFRDIAPEDEGFASQIEAHKVTAAELHYYNTGDSPVLREVWVNFYEADPSTVEASLNGVALIGLQGLEIGPYATEEIRYAAENAIQGRRLVNVIGHVHAHTTRFSAWRVTPSEERSLIYELYDWSEPSGVRFNTITDNPAPDAATKAEGGHSGLLYLDLGDRIEWECRVENDLGSTLYFANEALTAEMCILFGATPEAGWQVAPPRVK